MFSNIKNHQKQKTTLCVVQSYQTTLRTPGKYRETEETSGSITGRTRRPEPIRNSLSSSKDVSSFGNSTKRGRITGLPYSACS